MHIYIYILWGIVALLIPLTANAQVQGLEGKTPKAQLQFYDSVKKDFIDAPGVASDIHIDVKGTIARTSVVQYFMNDTQDWQEAIYMYPLPDDVAVDQLTMIVGDKRILGFVAQKEKARKIYEKAKADGKAAGLLEQHRPNIFKTAVANIPPQSLVAIEISYQHEVAIDGADFTLRMPLAITPRYDRFEPADLLTLASASEEGSFTRDLVDRLSLFKFEDGKNPVRLQVSLNAGFKAQNLQSSHKISIERSEKGTHAISLNDGLIAGEQDFVLHWQNPNPDKHISFAHSEKRDDFYYTAVTLVPPQNMSGRAEAPKRQVTMIIDTSGSMSGPSIVQAKTALSDAVRNLEVHDVFNVIRFESKTESLFDEPVPANLENTNTALSWINSLKADGGTEMMESVQMALAAPNIEGYLPQVVFMTDGAIGYENDLGAYIRDHIGDKRFYAVGIGAAPNAYLMRMFAEVGRGHATFINDAQETKAVMGKLFERMKTPVFQDIRLAPGEDSEMVEMVPHTLPDLMVGEPISAIIKTKQPIYMVHLYAEQSGEEWFQDIAVGQIQREGRNISKIYARRKIAQLNFNDPARKDMATEAEITKLGVSHQIVSAYTSLVAVGEEVLRPKMATVSSHRYNPNLPKGWQLAQYDPADAAKAYEKIMFEDSQNKDKDVETKNLLKHKINLPQTDTGYVLKLLSGLVFMILAALVWMRCRDDIVYV